MPSPVHPYSDYGVALRTLRSARSWLALLLFCCVVSQFVGFSLMWWTQQPYMGMTPKFVTPEKTYFQLLAERMFGGATTQSATNGETPDVFFPGTSEGRKLNIHHQWESTYSMTVPLTQMLGLVAASSMAIVVFVTLLVVLVGQAPGVAQVIKSLVWTVLLMFTVLPWQYFGNFPFPGILYGYDELLRMIGPHVVGHQASRYESVIVYARFIVWPLIALLLLLIASEKFRAGLMLAIGHPLQSLMQGRGGPAGPGGRVPPLPNLSDKKLA